MGGAESAVDGVAVSMGGVDSTSMSSAEPPIGGAEACVDDAKASRGAIK